MQITDTADKADSPLVIKVPQDSSVTPMLPKQQPKIQKSATKSPTPVSPLKRPKLDFSPNKRQTSPSKRQESYAHMIKPEKFESPKDLKLIRRVKIKR
jgi:hypothetical protein